MTITELITAFHGLSSMERAQFFGKIACDESFSPRVRQIAETAEAECLEDTLPRPIGAATTYACLSVNSKFRFHSDGDLVIRRRTYTGHTIERNHQGKRADHGIVDSPDGNPPVYLLA